MTTGTDIQDKAREAAEWFETASREGSHDRYIRVKDGAPECISTLVYEAHGRGDFLPDDWRYKTISEALEWIADADEPEDSSGDFADQAVDTYNAARISWLGSNLNRAGYVDEALADFGWDESQGIFGAIAMGQYREAEEIYTLVLQALES